MSLCRLEPKPHQKRIAGVRSRHWDPVVASSLRLHLDTKRVERVQIRNIFLLTYFTYVDLNVHVHVLKYTKLSVKKCWTNYLAFWIDNNYHNTKYASNCYISCFLDIFVPIILFVDVHWEKSFNSSCTVGSTPLHD